MRFSFLCLGFFTVAEVLAVKRIPGTVSRLFEGEEEAIRAKKTKLYRMIKKLVKSKTIAGELLACHTFDGAGVGLEWSCKCPVER